MRVIFLLLFLLAGCTSTQIDRGADRTRNVIGDSVYHTTRLVGHTANKIGDIIGLDQPEDPVEEMEDRRWQLCVAHPCEYKEQCARLYPGAFMSPSCKVAKRQGREPRVFGPQRPADNATNSELYRIIKRQCPDEKGDIARWECIAEFFDEEEIPK